MRRPFMTRAGMINSSFFFTGLIYVFVNKILSVYAINKVLSLSLFCFLTKLAQINGSSFSVYNSACISINSSTNPTRNESLAARPRALSIPLETNPLQIDTAPDDKVIEEVTIEEESEDKCEIELSS